MFKIFGLEIRWYSDSSAKAISPNATYSDRHYTWKTTLNKGDKYNIFPMLTFESQSSLFISVRNNLRILFNKAKTISSFALISL